MTTRQVSKDGMISYTLSNAGRKGTSYQIVLDYSKFLNVADVTGTMYRAGISIRVRADIICKSNNVNLSLGGLGIASSRGHIEGTLSVDLIGISGAEITSLLPIPTTLSQDAILTVVQAIGALKAKIWESGDKSTTTTCPQLIARVYPEDSVMVDAKERTFRLP